MLLIIDFIEKYISISGNSVVDIIYFAVIIMISFSIAFGLVGIIFNFFGFYDFDLMGGMHWIIRVTFFISLTRY